LIANILDKILFGALLLFTLQVPIISDHYLQFISGYYESTKQQVEEYKKNAEKHEYENVDAMIVDFMRNSNLAVREDGKQKRLLLRRHEALIETITILKTGNLFERALFMFHPSNWHSLTKVLENFRPGIPLRVEDFLLSTLTALFLSMFFSLPFRFYRRKRSAFENV